MSNLLQDIRYAARRLAASPAFTAAVIVTIALGVGANAAILGVAKSVLLDSLPYADAAWSKSTAACVTTRGPAIR